jgi:hypothetical protein
MDHARGSAVCWRQESLAVWGWRGGTSTDNGQALKAIATLMGKHYLSRRLHFA